MTCHHRQGGIDLDVKVRPENPTSNSIDVGSERCYVGLPHAFQMCCQGGEQQFGRLRPSFQSSNTSCQLVFLRGEGVDLGLTLLAAKSLQLSVEFSLVTDVAFKAFGCGRQRHPRPLRLATDLIWVAFRERGLGAVGLGLCESRLLLGGGEGLCEDLVAGVFAGGC